MIGTTIAPLLSGETRGAAREEERNLCCSSQAQAIDPTEGAPLNINAGVAVSPPYSVCLVVCLGVYALSL